MQIYPASKSKKLNNICKKLSLIINSEKFEKELRSMGDFDFSSDSDGRVNGAEVWLSFVKCRWDARVRFYKPWWPWSKVNGYYNPSKGLKYIFINSRRFYKRSERSCAETILHEVIHLIDYADKTRFFGHGDNSPIGKSESAPWKISEIIIKNFY